MPGKRSQIRRPCTGPLPNIHFGKRCSRTEATSSAQAPGNSLLEGPPQESLQLASPENRPAQIVNEK